MKKRMVSIFLSLVFLLALVTGCSSNTGGSPAQAQSSGTSVSQSSGSDIAPIKLKLAYNPPELDADSCLETNFATALRNYLDEHAPGRFQVETYPGAQLGSFSEMFSGVSDGSIETAMVNISTMISNDPNLNVWQIPGAIESIEECNALLADEQAMSTFDNLESKMGVTILTSYTAGARHFTNNKKEIKSLEDMRGIIFRVMENDLYIKMVESLGGIAVPMSSSELYSALQNGVVEGQENPISAIISDITYEVQNYLILDGHVYSIPLFVANTKWLDSLPDDLKPILLDGVAAGRKSAIDFINREEVRGLQFLKDKGMTVYEPSGEELGKWHEAVFDGTYDYIVNLIGQEKVDEFNGIIKTMRESR